VTRTGYVIDLCETGITRQLNPSAEETSLFRDRLVISDSTMGPAARGHVMASFSGTNPLQTALMTSGSPPLSLEGGP